jgi:hypothetical protein
VESHPPHQPHCRHGFVFELDQRHQGSLQGLNREGRDHQCDQCRSRSWVEWIRPSVSPSFPAEPVPIRRHAVSTPSLPQRVR